MGFIQVRDPSARSPRKPPADSRDERRLIAGARDGSSEALETLFRRYWPRAHRAAFLILHDASAAEDIAQEAFLAAVRALDRFDRRRAFGPWLHRIVVNRAIDSARARALRREAELSDAVDPTGPIRATGEPYYSDTLLSGLASLDPEQRAVIVLRYLLEYTPGEIAKILGLPRGTVNSRIRRGLDRLAVALGEESL